jgi:rod shape-determining protein MreC
MNKKFLLFLIALGIAVSYLFSFEKALYQELLNFNTKVQKLYLKAFVFVSDSFSKYFNQLDHIEHLLEQDKENRHYKVLYEQKQHQYSQLLASLEKKVPKEDNYLEVKVLSYYQMYDYSKVILDQEPFTSEQINALITYDGYSAGIVLNKNMQSVGYLNQNKKCNYTVFIGDENAPGITSGMDESGRLIIRYVPIWKNVHENDEVITSSMDAIFPYGIKVGKVDEIRKNENIQEVYVQTYADTLGNKEYYLYQHEGSFVENNITK